MPLTKAYILGNVKASIPTKQANSFSECMSGAVSRLVIIRPLTAGDTNESRHFVYLWANKSGKTLLLHSQAK